MTFKEYFRYTYYTTKYLLNLSGVIFTSIYVTIAIVFGYEEKSLIGAIKMFLICFILGNGLGIFIWLMAILSAYYEVKKITRFFNDIPESVKESLGLQLIPKRQNPKYNYFQFEIIETVSDVHITFSFGKGSLFITILSELDDNINFQKKHQEIRRKYRKQHITLTGWGLRKSIKRKNWKTLNKGGFEKSIEELITISIKENIDPINRNMEN